MMLARSVLYGPGRNMFDVSIIRRLTMVHFDISFESKTCDDVAQQTTRGFSISEKEYREFFAVLCQGVDSGKFKKALTDEILDKFAVEELLEG